MGLCLGAVAAITPFMWRILPQREQKGMLKDHDLDRLDAKVKVYERLATVENNQSHATKSMEGLQRDNSLIFEKLDDIKDRINSIPRELKRD